MGVAVVPAEVRDAAQQTESVAFVGQNQFGDNIVIRTAGEVPSAKPRKAYQMQDLLQMGQ